MDLFCFQSYGYGFDTYGFVLFIIGKIFSIHWAVVSELPVVAVVEGKKFSKQDSSVINAHDKICLQVR